MVLALIFDSAGFGEWFVLLAVVLIVVGPQRLPAAARKIGSFYAKLRRAAEGFKRQVMEMEAEATRAADPDPFPPDTYGDPSIPTAVSQREVPPLPDAGPLGASDSQFRPGRASYNDKPH